jgi:hypothetical protein
MEAVALMMSDAAVKSGTDLLVLMAIAHETEREGSERGTGSPAVQKLEALTRLSTRSVQRSLSRLVEARELEVDPKAGDEYTNVYRLPRLMQAQEPLEGAAGVNLAAMHCVMLYSQAGGNDLLVQIAVARFSGRSGKDKGKGYPGAGTLAKLTRLTDKTVLTALRRLEAIGELEIDSRPSRCRTLAFSIPGSGMVVSDLPINLKSVSKGSYGVDLTPGMSDRLEREICIRFADHLIESGRKDPLYRTDVESLEWRKGASYLHGGFSVRWPLWWEDPRSFLDGLYAHVVTSEQWPEIKNPSDVYRHLDEIQVSMREADRAAGVESDAKPDERSTRPKPPPAHEITAQERAELYQSLGLRVHRDARGWEVVGR